MDVRPPYESRVEQGDFRLSGRIAIDSHHGTFVPSGGFEKEGRLPWRDRFLARSDTEEISESIVLRLQISNLTAQVFDFSLV
jgi:hypothetical protein